MPKFVTLALLLSLVAARPLAEMNQAFQALVRLLPYLADGASFRDPANRQLIGAQVDLLTDAFTKAKHKDLLQEDIFAPSYELVVEGLKDSREAFRNRKSDYAHWRLREVTSFCIDCHTRIPSLHASSYQSGDLTLPMAKYPDTYTRGLAALIVRRYDDATAHFLATVDEEVGRRTFHRAEAAVKQLALIALKMKRAPQALRATYQGLLAKELPLSLKTELAEKLKELAVLEKSPLAQPHSSLETIFTELQKLRSGNESFERIELRLLLAAGQLAHYSFVHPKAPEAPEISFWLGWSEKVLKRNDYYGSANHFFKHCVRRYGKFPIARECMRELEESIEFDFTGSAGTDVPADVAKELKTLRDSLPSAKKN